MYFCYGISVYISSMIFMYVSFIPIFLSALNIGHVLQSRRLFHSLCMQYTVVSEIHYIFLSINQVIEKYNEFHLPLCITCVKLANCNVIWIKRLVLLSFALFIKINVKIYDKMIFWQKNEIISLSKFSSKNKELFHLIWLFCCNSGRIWNACNMNIT